MSHMAFDRRLIGEKVAAVDGVVEMLRRRVALAFRVDRSVDAALGATECERFTGTTEIRSTSCPASAIFIAAASPASPPPTMAIFKPVAISSYSFPLPCGGLSVVSLGSAQSELGISPHGLTNPNAALIPVTPRKATRPKQAYRAIF